MSKHTPGPWVAEISCDETGAPQKEWWISAKGDVDIGETSGEKRSDEEAANARLMAAAPDLYNALKKILPPDVSNDWWCPTCKEIIGGYNVTYQECCDRCGTYLGDINDPEWVEEAREAIEKAEGENFNGD